MSKITGSVDEFPSFREFFTEVLKRWRESSFSGRLYFNLLDCTGIRKMEFPATFPTRSAKEVIARLASGEHFDREYSEGRLHGEEGLPVKGCLILGEKEDGRGIYYISIFNEGEYDRCVLCLVDPSADSGNGRIALMTHDGWGDIAIDQINDCGALRIAFSTLKAILGSIETRRVPIASLIGMPSIEEPPDDEEMSRRYLEVGKHQMLVTTGITELENIEPYSIDFCLKLPGDLWESIAKRIQRGYRPPIAVYWNGLKFVMSDDYPAYLGYKKVGSRTVPVAVLGDFPESIVEIEKRGGFALLPPIGVVSTPVYPSPLTSDFKNWRLEQTMRRSYQLPIPGDLIATWIAFSEYLGDETVSEKELHEFILLRPDILTVYGTKFESEVRLGNSFRIDIVVRSNGLRESVTLVELEHHRHTIFTQEGQIRAPITHAVQQVQDWFRWIRENPEYEFSKSLSGIAPRGLVVAGRSREFSEDQRSRLAHLNSGSSVEIITYDELLERFLEFILRRIDDHRP